MACIYYTVEDVCLSIYLFACMSVGVSAQMKLFQKLKTWQKTTQSTLELGTLNSSSTGFSPLDGPPKTH